MILPDLHLNNKKNHRYRYDLECYSVIDKIHYFVEQEREHCDKLYAISLGDLVDGSKSSRREYTMVQQQLKLLIEPFDKFYLTIGNHEISYSTNNPIYSFIKLIENEEIIVRYPHLVPESSVNQIFTPKYIELENLEIVLGVWKIIPKPKTNKPAILMWHGNYLSKSGIDKIKIFKQFEFVQDFIDFCDWTHVFIGHEHTVVDKYNIGSTIVYNLGSLLRTGCDQVIDQESLRIIPILRTLNGNFDSIIYKEFKLHERNQIVDEISYRKSQEVYNLKKNIDQTKQKLKAPVLEVVDPITDTKKALVGQPMLLEILDKAIKGEL